MSERRHIAIVGLALACALAASAAIVAVHASLRHPVAPGATDAAAGAPTLAAGDRRVAFRSHLAGSPRDGRAWVLLARLEFDAERFADAADAYANALDVAPNVARDPGVWCEYADALAMAQGGVLAGRPREIVAHALALDPAHPAALEMSGSAAYEAGEYAAAARAWRQLLALLGPGTREGSELAAAVARAERLAAAASR
jgi:cytochrome c-type biogenesis protein CcmH